MASNPLIQQGTLNRLRGSVTIADFPNLNITAPYLGKAGIRLSLDDPTTTIINTMTGTVTSPEPYQSVTLSINLLKTNGLGEIYKKQIEDNTVIGNVTVTTDTAALSTYPLVNCAIESVRELDFSGEDAGYNVTIRGYYVINNSLWSLL
jgi:hypothetical protein